MPARCERPSPPATGPPQHGSFSHGMCDKWLHGGPVVCLEPLFGGASRRSSCARPVSGVGLGPRRYTASMLWSPAPHPSPVFRSAICDCLIKRIWSLQPSMSNQIAPKVCLKLPKVARVATIFLRHGPMWGWGSAPSSCRPRARVACVVWAWDLFITWRLCRCIPGPVGLQFFALRFASCFSF
jgi:hypothetical protein